MTHISAALRRLVHERAGGACEYCLAPEATALFAHEMDHVVAEKHGGTTTEDKLALACAACNLYKGSDIGSIDPVTGELVPCSTHTVIAGAMHSSSSTPGSSRGPQRLGQR